MDGTTPYKVSMLPTCGGFNAGVYVYETFGSQLQAESRRAEVLSSILTADDEDLTYIVREPHSGVCLKYFAPRLSVVRELSADHKWAADQMEKRFGGHIAKGE